MTAVALAIGACENDTVEWVEATRSTARGAVVACGDVLDPVSMAWVRKTCTAPEVCGGSGRPDTCGVPPWSHVSVPQGGYDYPLVTFWDGGAWQPDGTVPDPRSEQPSAAIHHAVIDYNRYAWERTGHPRDDAGTAFQPSDFKRAIQIMSDATGRPIHYYNHWESVVSDGTDPSIQIVPMVWTGQPVDNSPTPEADGVDHDSGASLFALVFPPDYDAERPQPYPLVLIGPGGGGTSLKGVLGPEPSDPVVAAVVEQQLTSLATLSAESVVNGGQGVVIALTNAGGQGSHGVGTEHLSAMNEIVARLQDIGNISFQDIVTSGGSRGGQMAFLYASFEDREYSVRAAFGAVAPSHFTALATAPRSLFPLHSFDTLSNFTPESIYGSSDPLVGDKFSSIGAVGNFDPGAWVEVTGSHRDWTGGAGIVVDYFDALPANLDTRLNLVHGSAHGGSTGPANEHFRLFVLDVLARSASYAGQFATVATGVHNYRLANDPAAPFADEWPSGYELLTPAFNQRIPGALLLPHVVQRDLSVPGSPVHESSGFVVVGDPGRAWEVDLVEPVSGNIVRSWSGVVGSPPSACSAFPRAISTVGALCPFDTETDQCFASGADTFCRWAFRYDEDGDGSVTDVPTHYTPFINPQAVQWLFGPMDQPVPLLTARPESCFAFDPLENGCGMATDASAGLPYNPHVGLPFEVNLCLNYATSDCTP